VADAAATTAPARPNRRLHSALWMILAVTMWTGVAICVRKLEGRVPITDLSFYRALTTVALMLPLILHSGRTGEGGSPLRQVLPWFAVRGLLIFCAQTAYYFSLTYLPIAEATVLGGTTTIFVALFAGLFLGERILPLRWVAIGVGFLGIVVIMRPGAETIQWAAVAALGSALIFGSASTINKYLSRTEPASRIVGWTNLMVAVFAVFPFAFNAQIPAWSDVGYIVAIAVLGAGAQYGLARGIAAADASFAGPFEFLRVPFAAIAGLLLFSEWPDVWVWIGTGIVFLSIFGLARDRALFRHRRGTATG